MNGARSLLNLAGCSSGVARSRVSGRVRLGFGERVGISLRHTVTSSVDVSAAFAVFEFLEV